MRGTRLGFRADRQARRHRRAVRRAFAEVTFYREQWAMADSPLDDPVPTAVTDLPDPPHTLTPFARPWSPAREPSVWTPDPAALAAALRLAGCGGRGRATVLEVRDALLDQHRLPGRFGGPAYGVLLSASAIVADTARAEERNVKTLAQAAARGRVWVVGAPADLSALPGLADGRLDTVHRVPVSFVEHPADGGERPVVLHDPVLGYVGARVPDCGRFHVDWQRVHVRERAGVVTFSLLGRRRPTLLEMCPSGVDRLRVAICARHATPVLELRAG
jgi:hypothetical protein